MSRDTPATGNRYWTFCELLMLLAGRVRLRGRCWTGGSGSPPPEVVGTSPDSIDYKDSKGNKRTADLKAIQQAISNLTE